MISVMAVVDCCWKQKNRGNSAKKKKMEKRTPKRVSYTPSRRANQSIAIKRKRKSIRSAFYKVTLFLNSLRSLPAPFIDVNVQSALSFHGGGVVIGNRLDRDRSDSVVVVVSAVQLRIRDRGR